MKVANKIFVVTGAGNGMGRELTLQLLSKNAGVAGVDIDEKGLNETLGLSNNNDALSLHTVDITNRDQVGLLPEHVIARHGTVDGLINNAGIIQPFVRVSNLDYSAIERVIKINFFGTLNMTKEFLPYLLQRPEAHIINISSMGGFLPVPGQTIYGASKAAVKLFTEGLFSELLDTHVRVTVVFPGAMSTNIAQNSGVGLNLGSEAGDKQKSYKQVAPGKAAQIIVKGIENDSYSIYIGRDSKYMNLLYRLSPKYAAKMIFKQMRDLLPD